MSIFHHLKVLDLHEFRGLANERCAQLLRGSCPVLRTSVTRHLREGVVRCTRMSSSARCVCLTPVISPMAD